MASHLAQQRADQWLRTHHAVITRHRAEGVERRLDTAYPDRMLTFEVDGHEHHSSPEQISADHDRREALRSIGWDVVVFTRNDVVRDGARVRRRAVAAYDRAGRRAPSPPASATGRADAPR